MRRLTDFLAALCLTVPVVTAPAIAADAPRPQPIIDMHVHILGIAPDGLPDWYNPMPADPFTGKPTRKFASEDEFMRFIFDELKRNHVVKAMVSNNAYHTARARKAYPNMVIPGVAIGGPPEPGVKLRDEITFNPSVDALRKQIQAGEVQVIGEVFPEYYGARLTDPYIEPYYALAEEMDVPIGVHTGLASAPAEIEGAGLRTKYRGDFGNPAGLEEVLNRHPKLRIYLMHAGHPYFAETYALLQSYPNVYVDIAYIAYLLPAKEFHRYLRQLVEAIPGVDKRIMFGTDTYIWTQGIKATIDRINAADYLTAQQKADIFCNNAQRFLRLDPKTCKR